MVSVLAGCCAICQKMCADCKPPSQCLTIDVVEQALNADLDDRLIAGKIREKGVNFELNDETRRRLRKAKANKIVLDAIEEANRKKTCGQSNKWF